MKMVAVAVAGWLALTIVVPLADASAQAGSGCAKFTVVVEDKLHNVKQGLSTDDVKWWDKLAKKYPAACYSAPGPDVPVVFYIRVTPDTYHGTRVVSDTSTASNPISGTITDQSGNTSQISGTEQTTTTSTTAVPYSFEYGIFTLSVERRQPDGSYVVLQSFQQKGIYYTYMYIPLGGRGHHPAHAVIEDAAKWVNGGGLANPTLGSVVNAPSRLVGQSAGGPSLLPAALARARAGDVGAQDGLGALYAMGDGVPQDFTEAARWFRRAAEQGDAYGEDALGSLYENGSGVPKDLALAFQWHHKAADQGYASSQASVGDSYYFGDAVPQDYAAAVSWYRKAADQGDAIGEDRLAICYEHGNGVPQDDRQAAVWYRRAAENGVINAESSLGNFYYFGRGVPQDYAQAAAWFRKAAEQGWVVAQQSLGRMYYNGNGLARDYAEAYYWLDLAVSSEGRPDQAADSKLRDLAASHLSQVELTQIQQRASKWFEQHSVSK